MITFLKGDNKVGIPKNDDVIITRSNKTLKYEITELQKFTFYTITVRAFTATDEGNESTISIRTSEDSKFDMCFLAFNDADYVEGKDEVHKYRCEWPENLLSLVCILYI